MANAAALVIAAGAIEAGNELVNSKEDLDTIWRIIPATAILALLLEGLDKLEPGFGSGLAGLVLLSVFVIPYGNAPTPLETAASIVGNAKSV